MSTRSGPYDVDVNGKEWTWEHDMIGHEVDGYCIRIFVPSSKPKSIGIVIEILFGEYGRISEWLPTELKNDIRNELGPVTYDHLVTGHWTPSEDPKFDCYRSKK